MVGTQSVLTKRTDRANLLNEYAIAIPLLSGYKRDENQYAAPKIDTFTEAYHSPLSRPIILAR